MKRLRFNPFSDQKEPESKVDAVEGNSKEAQSPLDELENGQRRNVSIAVPGYGGLTVRGGEDPTFAMLHVLDVLVKHYPQVDETLISYDMLLAQFPERPVKGFCVRRASDGWTLAVPAAETRQQAMLQIVQALLALQRTAFRRVMDVEGITPFRE
jgi:hypothetical protein